MPPAVEILTQCFLRASLLISLSYTYTEVLQSYVPHSETTLESDATGFCGLSANSDRIMSVSHILQFRPSVSRVLSYAVLAEAATLTTATPATVFLAAVTVAVVKVARSHLY